MNLFTRPFLNSWIGDIRMGNLKTAMAAFFILTLTLLHGNLSAQVVINEIYPNGTVELKNIGTTTVDVNSYWLCDFPDYQQIQNSNIICGDAMMAPGTILAVDDFNTINTNDGEMGLYINSSFGLSTAIIDYVEWGFSGHTRASVAAAANIWNAGDFVPAFSANASLSFDGMGDAPSNWSATATPSICMENGTGSCTADGGAVTFSDGTEASSICVDGNPDPLNVVFTTDASGANTGFVITDTDNNILGLPAAPPFDLDGAGVGTCIIWSVAYDDGLEGLAVGNNVSDLNGCFALSNGLTVYREAADGGMVSLTNGATSYANCAGNIIFDVTHTNDAPNLSYWYIITDANDNILAWLNSANGNTLDLSAAPAGECHVWGWSYRGLGDPIVGDHISTLADDDCEAISENWITVYREVPDGGTVSLVGGGNSYTGFEGNIVFDVEHTTTAPNLSYWYIITDESDDILGWLNAAEGNTLDLSVAPAGECHIWGWNYRGLGDPIVGENISTLADDNCEDISDNWITVIRQPCDVAGGILTGGPFTFCVDGNPDMVSGITLDAEVGNNIGWVITDEAGNILGMPPMPGVVDFDGAGVGTCFIWNIAYEDGLTGLNVGANVSGLIGCYDLSNPVTVYRQAPDGGTLTLANGATSYAQCAGNIVFDVTHTTAADMLSYWYIITDANDNILAWVNSADGNTLDLSAAPAGECHVWGWSYRGLGDPIVGDHISTLDDDDCEDITDEWITVYREVPDGGTVTLLDGSTSYAQCAGNIVFDVTHTTTAPNLSYWYIITDANDDILAWVNSADGNTLDLSGAPAGECHVWGWNYRGLDDPIVGENISTLADDDCEDISDEWITVYREVPDGGTVTLLDGSTSYAQCAGNIVFDVTHTTTAPNLSYWYIITDANDDILAWVNSADGNTLDLSGAPAGECHVWGWNYRGLDDPIVGENISTLADDDCEDISDEWITVYREVPDGGTVDSDLGTDITICVDDEADPITVNHVTTAPNLSYWYIITDDNDNILDWSTEPVIDLNGAGVGTCRIWGWNYRGLDDPIVGDPIESLNDDDCESISTNFITVDRIDTGAPCVSATTNVSSVSSINVYPNPTNDFVQIEFEGLLDNVGVLSLIDLTGRQLEQMDLEQQSGSLQLSMKNLNAGVYYIQINSAEGTTVRRVVKMD